MCRCTEAMLGSGRRRQAWKKVDASSAATLRFKHLAKARLHARSLLVGKKKNVYFCKKTRSLISPCTAATQLALSFTNSNSKLQRHTPLYGYFYWSTCLCCRLFHLFTARLETKPRRLRILCGFCGLTIIINVLT